MNTIGGGKGRDQANPSPTHFPIPSAITALRHLPKDPPFLQHHLRGQSPLGFHKREVDVGATDCPPAKTPPSGRKITPRQKTGMLQKVG